MNDPVFNSGFSFSTAQECSTNYSSLNSYDFTYNSGHNLDSSQYPSTSCISDPYQQCFAAGYQGQHQPSAIYPAPTQLGYYSTQSGEQYIQTTDSTPSLYFLSHFTSVTFGKPMSDLLTSLRAEETNNYRLPENSTIETNLDVFRRNLIKCRKKAGYSQYALGRELYKQYGVGSQSMVARFERGALAENSMIKYKPMMEEWLKKKTELDTRGRQLNGAGWFVTFGRKCDQFLVHIVFCEE